MLYSFYLWKAGLKERAETMMLHAQLRLDPDFNRCDNKRNSLKKYQGWYQGGEIGSQILKSYQEREGDKKSKQASFDSAFDVEEHQRDRPGDTWLCSSINWTKALAQYDKLQKTEVKNSGNLGKTIEVKPTKDIHIPASFIEDRVWLERRKEIREEFRKKYQ